MARLYLGRRGAGARSGCRERVASIVGVALTKKQLLVAAWLSTRSSRVAPARTKLGPFMEEYNSQSATLLSLFRGLFGDFDIASVMNTSSSWGNAIVLMMYLLGSIFILLSILVQALREQLRELKRNRSFERPSRRNGEDRGSLGV